MPAQRYNVSLEPELVARIDAAAGKRGRSAFLAQAAEAALAALASNGLPRPVAPITSPDGPRRQRADLHGDAGAGGWRPGEPVPEFEKVPGPLTTAQKELQGLRNFAEPVAKPKRRALGFDPSRFNQAKRLR